ncbi:Transposase, Ptta/En/Spm, plant [Quillaja saponaria]|uniref:Transposase, Ptta/En/Spm, plant n=1 Tax=Quillaja saponaria TaxID=32244 RepID=A0AAD7L0F2_QUISA|nr:Transposase, Ptta/En/Spm, plant [Quillaja saponaria]
MKARNNYNFRWHENPIDNVQEVDDDIFQEVELHVLTPVSVGADLDIPGALLGDGPMEEVNLNDITVPRFSDDDQLDEEEYAENDEWEDDDENDNVELDVDNEEVGFEYESNDDMEDDYIHGSGSRVLPGTHVTYNQSDSHTPQSGRIIVPPATDSSEASLGTTGTGESSRVPSINLRAPRGEFDDGSTVRTISTIIRAHMPGPYPTWSKFPEGARELCFRQFLAHYRFETEKEEVESKSVFNIIAAQRLKDLLSEARTTALKKCKTNDFLKCEGWKLIWMKAENWRGLLQIWASDKWQKLSATGTQNKLSGGDDSLVRHARGSISVLQYKEKMRKEFGSEPSTLQVYYRIHKKTKTGDFVNEKSKATSETYTCLMNEKYGENPTSHPEFDEELWLKATGGVKKEEKYTNVGRLDQRKFYLETEPVLLVDQLPLQPPHGMNMRWLMRLIP